jgi:hypothetical protein
MREDQFLITATVDGVALGVFDTCEGGDADSEETKYRPGGFRPIRTLGGQGAPQNVTIGRLEELERDTELVRWLMSRSGKGRMSVNKQPLDTDGNPFGRPFTYTGILKTVTPPNADSNSNSAAVWTAVLSTEGSPG